MGYNIAIDGPAGAGKSTAAKLTAQKLGYIYVDTGAMYRALAIHFLDSGISPENKEDIVKACETANVSIEYKENLQRVFLNGEDVTCRLRDENVGNMASVTSAIPQVREKLLKLQRELARSEDVIMDGRDIGTKILPNANLKIYLTASADARAKRRFDELTAKNVPCDFNEIRKDIEERDKRDMTRDASPLRKAEDALLVDTSDMAIEEVVSEILRLNSCRQDLYKENHHK